jgi:hypothetical protein
MQEPQIELTQPWSAGNNPFSATPPALNTVSTLTVPKKAEIPEIPEIVAAAAAALFPKTAISTTQFAIDGV